MAATLGVVPVNPTYQLPMGSMVYMSGLLTHTGVGYTTQEPWKATIPRGRYFNVTKWYVGVVFPEDGTDIHQLPVHKLVKV